MAQVFGPDWRAMPCYTKALGYVYPVCEVIAVSRLDTILKVSYRHETIDIPMTVASSPT